MIDALTGEAEHLRIPLRRARLVNGVVEAMSAAKAATLVGDAEKADLLWKQSIDTQEEMRRQESGRLRTYTISELAHQPKVEWLIEGWLQEAALHVLFGAPGTGKSLLALDWTGHLASGAKWHGCATERGPVLYIALEGQRGFTRARQHGCSRKASKSRLISNSFSIWAT